MDIALWLALAALVIACAWLLRERAPRGRSSPKSAGAITTPRAQRSSRSRPRSVACHAAPRRRLDAAPDRARTANDLRVRETIVQAATILRKDPQDVEECQRYEVHVHGGGEPRYVDVAFQADGIPQCRASEDESEGD